ncbi:serine/threonine-protein kinase CDG1-like [Cornus florida]|uniref:serine/threonine-protein kinase CDG1-like n=1 Tax=Cornus florida TaxID=4283 RepID=UPI00289632FC|nr:serine/threonine-protein kinase CDG1-like [Cornus florida]
MEDLQSVVLDRFIKGYLRDGIAIAVKVLDTQRNGSWKSFFAECTALSDVRHRNLVRIITYCSSIEFRNIDFLAVVYEFMSNESMEDWIIEYGHGEKPYIPTAGGDVYSYGIMVLELFSDAKCSPDGHVNMRDALCKLKITRDTLLKRNLTDEIK